MLGVQHIDLADSLVAALNTAIPGLNALRRYVLPIRREDLVTTTVSVLPDSESQVVQNRSSNETTIVLNIVVQKAVNPVINAEVDVMVKLVESIKALYDEGGTLRNSTLADCVWNGELSNTPLWIAEHLYEQKVFSSIIKVTYISADE